MYIITTKTKCRHHSENASLTALIRCIKQIIFPNR
jgi:hypothetical protein